MAVYEQIYRPYTGSVTAQQSRFLVIPRYGLQETFGSKLFLAFFVVCFLPPLGAAAMVWVLHNATFLEFAKLFFGGQAPELEIGGSFFFALMVAQGSFALLMTMLAAPPLISADLRNNALPLYLSRPFSRAEYVVGKLTILLVLLSSITVVPLLLLFALQSFLAEGWFSSHLGIAASVVAGSGIWIVVLSLAGLAVSATVKWKPIARVALFALFFLSWVVAKFFNGLFDHRIERPWGDVLSPIASIRTIWQGHFGVPAGSQIPAWSAWAALILGSLLCLVMLGRKVRAYEVVR